MKQSTLNILEELIQRYPQLSNIKDNILKAYEMLENAYKENKKVLVCGNGGSASDSEHIIGELMKRFKKPRPIKQNIYNELEKYGEEGRRLQNKLEGSLRSISLTSHIALSTAFSNDADSAIVFAQQLYGLADEGDILICLSTSGNSENCVLASLLAKAMKVKTIVLTGNSKNKLSEICDVTIQVPELETYKIQELHLPIYHCLCAMLEEEFF